MKLILALLVAALATSSITGCGGPDRAALARKTVQTYWNDIKFGRVKQAYQILSSGQKQVMTLTQYGQNMFDFLKGTEGVTAVVGDAHVKGDCASVPVTLKASKAPDPKQDLHAYQDLFWENGSWRISNENGGLTHASNFSCG